VMTALETEELDRIRIGDTIKGFGLPDGTTVTAKAEDQLTVSNNATASTEIVRTGTLTADGLQMTVASATGLAAGQTISGTDVPSGTTIQKISGTTITLSIAYNENIQGSATTKTTTYKVVSGQARLYMNDTSGIAKNDLLSGEGVYAGTKVVGISTNKFVQINKEIKAAADASIEVTFYVIKTFTAQTYTFRSSDRYVIRPEDQLPFGSFPGVGTVKV